MLKAMFGELARLATTSNQCRVAAARSAAAVLPLVCALCLVSAPVPPAAAQSEQQAEAKSQLAQLRVRIQGLHQRLARDHTQRDQLARTLRDSESKAAALATELRDVEAQLNHRKRELDTLRAGKENARQVVARERLRLHEHIRAAYRMSLQGPLQLLLGQDDPAAIARVLTYASYFERAKAERVRALSGELTRLRELEQQVNRDSAALSALARDKELAALKLGELRAARRHLLRRLEADIGERDARLARLEADAKQLEELLVGLARELPDEFAMSAERRPFAELKGKLPWPLNGDIRHAFGESRGKKGLKWRGVAIAARAGDPVQAVYHGRVAFANWLRGFGLLLIIDHGDGYLSLYGHNESLSAELGDWVSPGDIIAHVGDTGGAPQSSLYFEIRRRGVPVDPRHWCNREVAPAGSVLVRP